MSTQTVSPTRVPNVIGGREVVSESLRTIPLTAPATGEVIAEVAVSTVSELDAAVFAAEQAQKEWGAQTIKERAHVLFVAKRLFEEQTERIARLISRENGKTVAEAGASVSRGIECIEFATSLPQIATGEILEVSRGVECKTVRFPLGVVASITPFNFPAMVPLWMVPMAIGMGNAIILKPSEQTPLAGVEIAKLFLEAGTPRGIVSVVHGDRETVEAICDHPGIRAIGFVGSTTAARAVYERGTANGKRVRAMGGAKNHLVIMPDADPEMTAANVVASSMDCAGQRCMAASVLLAVGDVDHIIDQIREKMSAIEAGSEMGAIISSKAKNRIEGYVARAGGNGAEVILDGRNQVAAEANPEGNYCGPTVIDHAPADHEAACNEIFGPTLTIVRCKNLEEALAVENGNAHGNAAAIYTSSGEIAQYFGERASAGMVGINIGVPVPREPFAFGGWNQSSFGGGDITGRSAIDFWSKTKKITTKWSDKYRKDWMS